MRAALEERQVWPAPDPIRALSGRIIATYDYRDADGVLLYQSVRFEPKDFRLRRPDGNGGWIWNLDGVPRVLYRFPELLAADPAVPVFVSEGEKDVDRLLTEGLLSATNPGGAGKWRPEYADALRGRHVVILPDNDDPGREHAHQVAAALKEVVASVKIIELVGLPPKGDVSDWFDAGGTKENLLALVCGPTTTPPAETAASPIEGPESFVLLHDLLDRVTAFLTRYVAFRSKHQVVAETLWVAHAHAIDAADITPYLAITSAERQSGKTRNAETLETLVPRPWRVVKPSDAVVFRKIEADLPTFFLDEVDAVFKDRAGTYEGLRAMLNAGNARGVTVPRCLGEGKTVKLIEFSVFCPKALIGIGELPDTVADRSIPIRQDRHRRDLEPVERFRRRDVAKAAAPIRQALAQWATPDVIDRLRAARPDLPQTISDRAADGWEPLLAIADLAGGEWPKHAREAATALHADASAVQETDGTALLRGIREVFRSRKKVSRADEQAEQIFTVDLAHALMELEDEPWAEAWDKIKDNCQALGHRLRKILKPYQIFSKKVRIGEETRNGYELDQFTGSFARYLLPLDTSNPPGTLQHRNIGTNQAGQGFAIDSISEHEMSPERRQPLQNKKCSDVPMLDVVQGGTETAGDATSSQDPAYRTWRCPRCSRTAQDPQVIHTPDAVACSRCGTACEEIRHQGHDDGQGGDPSATSPLRESPP